MPELRKDDLVESVLEGGKRRRAKFPLLQLPRLLGEVANQHTRVGRRETGTASEAGFCFLVNCSLSVRRRVNPAVRVETEGFGAVGSLAPVDTLRATVTLPGGVSPRFAECDVRCHPSTTFGSRHGTADQARGFGHREGRFLARSELNVAAKVG
jgi:hypothetical protein